MRAQVSAWEAADDPRAVFLGCYAMMTENMLRAVGQGRFRDGEWVEALLHRFADYYFDALACCECGDPAAPEAWRRVHDACTTRRMHVLQHLLLGVNAHINYDLVLTLYDVLHEEWPSLDAEGRARRLQDHLMVNQVIAETVDRVQDDVVERHDPLMRWVDTLLGRLDERFLAALITSWRHEVWEHAQAMLGCSCEEEREALRCRIEADVLRTSGVMALGSREVDEA